MHINLPDGKIGVAVSGGVDSMALLYSALKSKKDITVINIEHGIRGTESQKDSDFVRTFCRQNNIEFLFFPIDTIAESKKRKQSVELTARTLRYEIFYRLLKEKKVDWIALGHHANDNAETILMRILRGTGIRGLKGIVDHSGFIHPLIKYSRYEIEQYAKQNNIPYVNDSTNSKNEYTRNFLRNDIFKKLEKRFDNVYESFTRLAQNAQEADEFIMSNTLQTFKDNEGFYLLIDDFQSAHSIIKKYSLLKLFNQMDVCQDIEAKHFDYIIELCHKKNNSYIDLPFNIKAVKEYDKLFFYKQLYALDFYEKLDYNKSYLFNGVKYSFIKTDKIKKGLSFDAEKIPKHAVIRTRQDGDIFKRYAGGTKKLNDYLTDIKLPVRERDNLLLVAYGNEVFIVCGIEISDKIKIDNNTKEILYIKKEIL